MKDCNFLVDWSKEKRMTTVLLNKVQSYAAMCLSSHSKWFEPRSISSLYCVIVLVRVVLKRTVVGDYLFDDLKGSHLQSHVKRVFQSSFFLQMLDKRKSVDL